MDTSEKYILSRQEETILDERDVVKDSSNYYINEQLKERLAKWFNK